MFVVMVHVRRSTAEKVKTNEILERGERGDHTGLQRHRKKASRSRSGRLGFLLPDVILSRVGAAGCSNDLSAGTKWTAGRDLFACACNTETGLIRAREPLRYD